MRHVAMPSIYNGNWSTLFETIEVKFTTGEGDATRFAKMLANADSMLYSAWAVTAP